ncbi:hypothetical protein PENSPDRAFT_665548 [Peniophora sp. CONT]|nr:hypothetical protein PENSPDRAFT_665548 [Peniophora sp. CONT]
MSVRSRRSKATPPPLDIPEDAIAGPSSSAVTLALPPHPHDSQSKSQLFKRVLRRHGSFGSIRTLAGFSSRPGDRSSVESTYSSSADSEHSLSGTTAYSPSEYGDSEKEKGKEVIVIEPDADEELFRKPVLVTPLKPDYAFEGCEGLLELDRETNDVLSLLTRPGCPSFLRWESAPTRILDIGCGFGDWAVAAATAWPFARVTGVDVNSRWDALSGEKIVPANAAFEEHDFLDEPLPFEDDTFDYVRIANCQFRVKPTQWRFLLSEAHRVLQMNGRVELIDEELVSPDTLRDEIEHSPSSSVDDLMELQGKAYDAEPQSVDEKLQRNCQELETIFHHALRATGLEPSQDGVEGDLPTIFHEVFNSTQVTPSRYELCASLPKKKKTSKFFGAAVQREQHLILRSPEVLNKQPRLLSLDPRYALRGSDALLACQDFIHSFVAQQLDEQGSPLVPCKELNEALWDYESFRERRFLWRSERQRAAFDDDADMFNARSRPGPRRSDGGDTGSMVESMRRAFERTSSDSLPFPGRRTLERSYSFDSDVTPRPGDYSVGSRVDPWWVPGESYTLAHDRKLVVVRTFRVYWATKEVQKSPIVDVHPGMADYRKSFMQRTRSSTPVPQAL